MNKTLRGLAFLAGLFAAIVPLSAQIVYFQLSGTGNASGKVDGVPFANQDWVLEFGVNTAIADADPGNADVGSFPGSMVSGLLRLGSTTYTLAGATTGGGVSLYYIPDSSSNYSAVDLLPSSGGYATFLVSASAMVPLMFSNANNLSSVNTGSSLANTSPDAFNNGSGVNYSHDPDPEDGHDNRLVTTGGQRIELSIWAAPGSGDMTFAISGSSVAAVPEPATTTLLLALASGLAVLHLRRRRAAAAGIERR